MTKKYKATQTQTIFEFSIGNIRFEISKIIAKTNSMQVLADWFDKEVAMHKNIDNSD